jgi:hypothetical protein
MRAKLNTISAISARSRRPTIVVTSMLSISARASSGDSTGVLPTVAVCDGPRTELADHQPVEQETDRREPGLDGRGHVLLNLHLDPRRDMKRLHWALVYLHLRTPMISKGCSKPQIQKPVRFQ